MVDQLITDILCNVKEKMKEYFFLKTETYNKDSIDNTVNNLDTKIDTKSTVTFTKHLTTGTKIGTIKINNNSTDIYCETNTDTQYTPASTTPLADEPQGKPGTSTNYARADHIHPTDKTKVEFNRTLNTGKEIGTIKIDNNDSITLYCDENTDTKYDAATKTPLADTKNGNVGVSAKYAREDHIHPTDKTKVEFNRTLNSGKEIGVIKIDNNPITLYCDQNTDTIYNHPSYHSSSMIQDPNGHSNINTSANATQTDINKAIDTAIGKKVNMDGTKVLSANDYTDADKNKLSRISTEANKVSFTQTKTSGIEIGKISIDGVTTPIFQQDNNTTYSNATTSSSGLMSPDDKKKLDVQSDYQIFLTDYTYVSNNPNNAPAALQAARGQKIYAMVKKNGVIYEGINITFIIHGVAYDREAKESNLGLAALNIGTLEDGNYTVIALYRENGWATCIDVKPLKVQGAL